MRVAKVRRTYLDNEEMVIQALGDERIQIGKDLLVSLARKNVPVTAAFWFYYRESDEWKLILSLPQLAKEGPKAAYAKIQKLLPKSSSAPIVRLSDIGLVKPKDWLVRLLGIVIKTRKDAIANIVFEQCSINNRFVDSAYIYRLS